MPRKKVVGRPATEDVQNKELVQQPVLGEDNKWTAASEIEEASAMPSGNGGKEAPVVDETAVPDAEENTAIKTAAEGEIEPTGEASKPRLRRRKRSSTPSPSEKGEAAGDDKTDDEGGVVPLKRTYRDTVISRTKREEVRRTQREEEEAFRSSWGAMQAAMDKSIVLEGKVFGVSEVYHEDPRYDAPVGEAMLTLLVNGAIKVTMPFFEFYSRHPVSMDTVDLSTPAGRRSYLNRQMNMARKLVGITVPFVVTNMYHGKADDYNDEGQATYAIAASRKKALAILARRNFASINGSQPMYKEGDIVKADVISVAPHALQVNFGGVDARIPVANLTFRLVTNATKMYRSGEQVTVKIRSVSVDKNGTYELELNGRDVELQEAKKRHFLLNVGMCVHGTFININQRDDGTVTAVAHLSDVDLPAMVRRFAPRSLGAAPKGGDEATLVVVGFHESGFVITNCTGILNDTPTLYSGF